MNVVAIPIVESKTELQGTRHSSMTARDVGGTTDRNSLSARQANGAAMLVEVDAAAVAVLLLVRLIAEGREVVRRLPVRKEVEQPQKLAVNAARGRHARRQEREAGLPIGSPPNWERSRAPNWEFCLLKGIAEGTYNTKHAEAARLYYTTILLY